MADNSTQWEGTPKDFLAGTFGIQKASKELETVGSIVAQPADVYTQATINRGGSN